MENLRFGTFCHLIVDLAKKSQSEQLEHFKTDMGCFNEILYLLSRQTTPYLEQKFEIIHGYKIPPSRISEMKSGEKNLLQNLVKALLKDDKNHRIKLIKEGLDILKNNSLTSQLLAQKLIDNYSSSSYSSTNLREDISGKTYIPNLKSLKKLYQEEDYLEIIARLLYFVSTYVPNTIDSSKTKFNQTLKKTENNIQNLIYSGAYYDSFYREILMFPSKETKSLHIKTTTDYYSDYISPLHQEKNIFRKCFNFDSEIEYRNHKILSLKINDYDYTDSLQITDDEPIFSSFSFRREYIVNDIPTANKYHVEMVVQSITETPIYQMAYRFPVPCAKFQLNVSVKGKLKEDFKLHFSMFSIIDHHTLPNYINSAPDSNIVSVGLFELIPKGSGYSLNIRPKYSMWKNYIDTSSSQNH